MKAFEMRELTPAELVDLLDETKQEEFNLRFQLRVSQSEDTAGLGELRRRIARIKTIMHEAAMEEAALEVGRSG